MNLAIKLKELATVIENIKILSATESYAESQNYPVYVIEKRWWNLWEAGL